MKKITLLFTFFFGLLNGYSVFGQTDIIVTNTNNQGYYISGQTITYNVVVSNLGPNSASNVAISNPIPAGIAYFSWTGSNGSFGINAPLTNTIGNLAVGQIVTYIITVEIPNGFIGNLTSTASITTSTTDINTSNNTSTDIDLNSNTNHVNLEITNSDNQSTYTLGGTNIYTVKVTNEGPRTATNVVVTNPIPAGITSFSWVGDNGSSGTNANLVDNIASFPKGFTVIYTITLDVPLTFSGNLTSQATVSSSITDPDLSNNTATDVDFPRPIADIVLTNTDNQTEYILGGTNIYTLTVTNNGPDNATNVVVTNFIPAGITSFSWTGSNGSSGTNVALNNTIPFLANGNSVTYTITLNVPTTFTGDLVSNATVSSGSYDPDTSCTSCIDTDVLSTMGADIVVTNTDNQTEYIVGGTNIYTLTVTNNGPFTASGIVVTNPIPAGITSFSWTGSNGSSGTNIALNNTIPFLTSGSSVVYTITINVPLTFTGNLVSTASTTTTTLDPDTTCASCVDTDVITTSSADIVVVNTDGTNNYTLGANSIYTVTVTNLGPQDATNVVVSNLIPAGITNFSWVGDNGSSGTNTDLVDNIALLTVGTTITYTITLNVPLTFSGNLTSQTTVTSTTIDPNPSCSSCTDINVPLSGGGADLNVVLTDGSPTYTAGTTFNYTLTVTNNGPEDAINVSTTGGVPTNINPGFVSWTGNNGSSGTGNITNVIPNLVAGTSVIYTITVFVPSDFDPTQNLVNFVNVTSTTIDPNPDCFTCSDVDTPNPLANLIISKTDNKTQYSVGSPNVYTITIYNQGPSDAFNVVVTDAVPVGTTMSWSNSLGDSGTGAINQTISSIPVNGTVIFNVVVSIPLTYNSAANVVNTVVVSSDTTDPSPTCPLCTDTDTPSQNSISVEAATVTNTPSTYDVSELVTDVLIHSSCAQISNFTSSPICGIGYFKRNNADFDFKEGMILRNGTATLSQGNYSGASMSTICSNSGDAELLAISQANGNPSSINDVTFVKFNFTPLTDSFSFNFIFASNEYGTFQCGFSDVFAFILTDLTTGISTNLAVIPNTTTPVSVTNIRDTAFNPGCPSVNPTYFDTYNVALPPANTIMNMRGYTIPMTAFATVIPNNNYSIKLAIGDYQDTAFDSAVFIEAGSFNVGTAAIGNGQVLADGSPDLSVINEDLTIANGLALCPGETRDMEISLDPSVYTFEWSLDGVVIPAVTGPIYTITQPGTYCVTANAGTGGSCIQSDCLIVEYLPGFVINNNPDDLLSCDNNFDLSENTVTILNGLDPFTYDVLFYATLQDAIDNFNQIPALQTTTQTVTTFYVRVENFAFACPQITQFDAIVSPCQATMPPDMIVCDDISNNGTETFDLTAQNVAVLGGLAASDFTITYHLTQVGADANNNLATPANAFVGGPNQVIYVRMESNANPAQYSTTTFTLIVLPLPTATISANTTCEGQTGTVTITGTPNATVHYTVDGGTTQTVVLDASGIATVTTAVLSSNSIYCLVDVVSNTTPACTQLVTTCATVIVNPLPVVSISTTTPSICDGTSATIVFTGTADATITYTIDGASNTIVLDGSGNGSVIVTSTSTYCLVNAASNATPVCNQAFTDCVTITVIPLPTVTIAGDTVCAGDTATVTFTGTPGATVNYNLGATAETPVVLAANGIATVTTTSPAGVYTYTVVDVTSATTPPCTTPIVGEVATVTVLTAPVIGPISDIHVCDDDNNGTAAFDLTPAVNQAQTGNPGSTVTVHPTLADAQNDANALTAGQILAYNSTTQLLHIRVENAGGCFSLTTVNLIVDPRPVLNQSVASYELCDVNAPGDGIEVFDLTNATLTTDITNGATGLTLSYYTSLADAQVPQNAIVSPTAYPNATPNQQTIWVVGQNAAGCRHITSFDLIVNPLPPITPLAPMNGCSDGINPNSAPFNLTLNDVLVTNGSSGYNVTYHLNQADADNDASPIVSSSTVPYNSISNPQIIYVRVENATTGCYDTTTVQLNVTQGPTANQPSDLTYCDPDNDGYGEFDLQSTLTQISGGPTPVGVTITFHETQADAMQVPPANPILATPYLNNVQDLQTIYVAVSYDLTGCTNYTDFNLIVNPTPVLNLTPSALEECDDAVADGITQFDLTQANADIIGTINPATVQITYHLTDADAQAGTPLISNILSYTNSTANQQTIYVRVEFIATGCFKVVPLDLIVNPRPNMPTPESIVLTLCDDNNSGDQQELFDLTGHIPNIVGTQTNMNVTFYLTQADALAGTPSLQLPSPYQNTSNTQSIFVRVENAQTGCFDVVILDLRVEPLPILLMPNAAATTICDDDAMGDGFSTFDLTALVPGMLNGAPNVTVSFYETVPDANVNPPILPIQNPSAYMNIDPYVQIIYVLAENTLTGCKNVYPLTLTVNVAPEMPPLPDLVECDNNYDGVRLFDLTQQNAAILAANPGIPATPLPIRYYQTLNDAMNGTAAIVNTAAYQNQTNPQTIWVVITDPITGCSAMDSFELIVDVPVNVTGQNNELTLCDDGVTNDQVATFDLTVLDTQIIGTSPVSVGATVVYYASLANAQTETSPITPPTAFTNTVNPQNVWAVVTTTAGCKSIALAKVRVVPSPTPFMNPIALETCDDDQTIIGSEEFDVTQNQTIIQNGFVGLVFEYYPTLADAEAGTNIIISPTTYEGGNAAATPPTNIVYIKVKNAYTDFYGNNCYKIVEQELIVNPLPVVDVTDFVNCDDDNDGIAEFTLSNYNEDLLGTTQPIADFTVTYYDTQANAQNVTSTVGLLPNVYTNTVNNELIYPRIVNNTTGCINASATVTLIVKEAAIANIISQTTLDEFTVCDYDGVNDGFTVFDLTIVETEVYGAQTTPPVLITYHTSFSDADAPVGLNPILNPSAYLNTSNPQTIFIRVTRDNTVPGDTSAVCHVVSSQTIELNVEPLAEPIITSDTGYDIICVDYNTGLLISGLTLDSGIPAGSGYTYQWALNGTDITGATNATYTITDASPGIYSVIVTSTSPQGCMSEPTNDSMFEVIQSGPATNLQSFINGSFEETQTITITYEGYGTYEFQLDGEGPWQSSPVFTNVPAGEHFVLVRDATNPDYRCDEERIDDVSIINYPHFFTPNGDGVNDKWNITGLSSQTNAKIYIFDRYGKLLKQISAAGDGWNGTFNGQPLPATDYWFTVDYYEITTTGSLIPKQFKAHFSLKR